jgi:ADP-ribose pyrophosphatase YjhB (NUDIX family)
MNTVNIYIGEKRIILSSGIDKYLKISDNNILLAEGKAEKEELKNSFKRLIKSKNQKILLVKGRVRKSLEKLVEIFPLIEAAGGFIQNKEKGYLFILRNGKWDLPKGKIERNEKPRKAAVRECEEECGINELKIKKKLKPTYHMYQLKGKWMLKKTHWYKMKTRFAGKLIPQKEEGIQKAKWLKESDFPMVMKNTYASVKEVMNSI